MHNSTALDDFALGVKVDREMLSSSDTYIWHLHEERARNPWF